MKLRRPLFVVISLLMSSFVASEQLKGDEKSKMKQQIEAVQTELDNLVENGGKYAYMQLARKNYLSPFAVAVEKDGDTLMLEVSKEHEGLTVADKVLKLREMIKLAADNEKINAGALFVQAQVPHLGKKVDGVAIEMEHIKGLSVLRFSPYEVDRDKQQVKFDKPVDKIKPVVFFKDVAPKKNS